MSPSRQSLHPAALAGAEAGAMPSADGGIGPGEGAFALEIEENEVDERVVVGKLNSHLVALFFALGVVCYLDRTNLSFAAIQLNRDLQLSCSTYGLGAGLFFVSYSLFQLPANAVQQRIGAPLFLSATVLAWGVVAASFSLINGTALFLVLRMALGLTECGTFPGMWAHLSHFYTPHELGEAYSKVATSTALAQVLGAPLAAGILTFDGALGLHGWQWLFIIEGAITAVFGVILRFVLAPSPAQAKFLTRAERSWLQKRQDAQPNASKGSSRAQMKTVVQVLRNWRVWYQGCLWVNVATSMYGIIFFAPLMIAKMFSTPEVLSDVPLEALAGGNSSSSSSSTSCSGEGGHGGSGSGAMVALLSMLPFAAAAAAMVINASLAAAANERHRHAGLPIGLGALFMALTPLTLRYVAPAAAFLCLVLSAAFVWAFHGPFMSWPAVYLRGPEASAGFSAINSVGSLGGLVGPTLIGALVDRTKSYEAALYVLAFLLGLSSAGILLFPVPTSLEPELAVVELGGRQERGGGEREAKGLERLPILRGGQSSADVHDPY